MCMCLFIRILSYYIDSYCSGAHEEEKIIYYVTPELELPVCTFMCLYFTALCLTVTITFTHILFIGF